MSGKEVSTLFDIINSIKDEGLKQEIKDALIQAVENLLSSKKDNLAALLDEAFNEEEIYSEPIELKIKRQKSQDNFKSGKGYFRRPPEDKSNNSYQPPDGYQPPIQSSVDRLKNITALIESAELKQKAKNILKNRSDFDPKLSQKELDVLADVEHQKTLSFVEEKVSNIKEYLLSLVRHEKLYKNEIEQLKFKIKGIEDELFNKIKKQKRYEGLFGLIYIKETEERFNAFAAAFKEWDRRKKLDGYEKEFHEFHKNIENELERKITYEEACAEYFIKLLNSEAK